MTALAFELAARIELYESELDALRATWSDAAGSARRDCARQLLAAVQTLHGKCVAHFVKH
jgi:hypothetical protein